MQQYEQDQKDFFADLQTGNFGADMTCIVNISMNISFDYFLEFPQLIRYCFPGKNFLEIEQDLITVELWKHIYLGKNLVLKGLVLKGTQQRCW